MLSRLKCKWHRLRMLSADGGDGECKQLARLVMSNTCP
jgi:hypothetical protein